MQFYSHSSQYLVRNAAIVTNDWMNDLECIEYKEGIFSNFLNGPSPASYFLQKCENRLSSIRQQESNSHILDDESPPSTTRPPTHSAMIFTHFKTNTKSIDIYWIVSMLCSLKRNKILWITKWTRLTTKVGQRFLIVWSTLLQVVKDREKNDRRVS